DREVAAALRLQPPETRPAPGATDAARYHRCQGARHRRKGRHQVHCAESLARRRRRPDRRSRRALRSVEHAAPLRHREGEEDGTALRHRRQRWLEEVAGGVMSELLSLLCNAVRARSRDDAAALLLSGGIDSTSVGIALQECGKTIRAYTYCLQGYESKDLKKAIAISRHFGWPLTIIKVPTADAARDFMRLAVEHRCRKKPQFDNTFPLLYVLPRIAEAEVWTGYNADDHYGNTKNCALDQKRMAREGASAAERKDAFDAERRGRFERLADPESD